MNGAGTKFMASILRRAGGRNIMMRIASDKIRFEFRSGGQTLIIEPLPFEKPPRDERYMDRLREIAERIYKSPNEVIFRVFCP